MDPDILKKIQARNIQLVDLVIQKVITYCPSSIDLIGIAGSFATGDVHEGSDLDLLIVSNDDRASLIDSCFILGNVAYDFYTSPWSRLEDMANYTNPHLSKLFNLDIVYQRDDSCLEKYNALRTKCESNLKNETANFEKARRAFDDTLTGYARLILSDDLYECRKLVFQMSTKVEYSLYFLNNTYMKRGIRRVPEEIEKMTRLPDGFISTYQKIFESKNIDELKQSSTEVIKLLDGYINQLTNHHVDEISSKALTGTYEEVFSNWKNKMILAADTGNKYLAFTTMSGCQQFYDEKSEQYNIPHIKIIQNFDPDDLSKTSSSFDEGMLDWKKLYDQFNKPIRQYINIEEFAKDYLSQK